VFDAQDEWLHFVGASDVEEPQLPRAAGEAAHGVDQLPAGGLLDPPTQPAIQLQRQA
jgi:hypothetical protein